MPMAVLAVSALDYDSAGSCGPIGSRQVAIGPFRHNGSMGGTAHFVRLAARLFGIAVVWMCAGGPGEAADAAGVANAAVPSDGWRSRVSAGLLSIHDSPPSGQSRPGSAVPPASLLSPRFDANGSVQVDVHYDCSLSPPTQALASAGLTPNASVKIAPLCVVEGWIAPAALSRIASIAGVTGVQVPAYAVHIRPRTGTASPIGSAPLRQPPEASARAKAQAASATIDHNGVSIMRADQFVAQTNVRGAGVTVGVQSTGVYSLSVIQGRGELPAVSVVNPAGGSSSSFSDEGTALLQEVHAVAPGAGLAFCGPESFIEYTSCLGQLVAAGATVLVDDVVFPQEELMSLGGVDQLAVEQVLSQNPNVAMFTAAGNYNGSYWEGAYSPVTLASQNLPPLSCQVNGQTQVDNYVATFNGIPSLALTASGLGVYPVTFAWADPNNQNVSNFDLYWMNNSDGSTGCFPTASATGTLISPNLTVNSANYTLYVGTPDASLAGKYLKLWVGGDGLTTLSVSTAGSVISPQAFAAGVITVGAVNGSDGVGNSIESFSSLGPITLAVPTPSHIQAPTLVAPDGINVDAAGTYFAAYLFPDGNFYGTSASVPNAGAVAALLRSAFPALTVPQLVAALQAGATQLGPTVPDGTFGYGRIDAIGALGTLPSPTMTALPDSTITAGSRSADLPFTVTGTGHLHFSVTSSNAALIPASIVPAGTPGVALNPSTCGTTALTCTLSVTAATHQGDNAKLTVAVVDGANRSAPATMTITVTGDTTPAPAPPPAPPTVTVTSGGGGGALSWWEVAALALFAGIVAIGRNGRGKRRVRFGLFELCCAR